MPESRKPTEAELLLLLAQYEPADLPEPTLMKPPRHTFSSVLAVAAAVALLVAGSAVSRPRPSVPAAWKPTPTVQHHIDAFTTGNMPASAGTLVVASPMPMYPQLFVDLNSLKRPTGCLWEATVSINQSKGSVYVGQGREVPFDPELEIAYRLPAGVDHAIGHLQLLCKRNGRTSVKQQQTVTLFHDFVPVPSVVYSQRSPKLQIGQLHYRLAVFKTGSTYWTSHSGATDYSVLIARYASGGKSRRWYLHGKVTVFEEPQILANNASARADGRYRTDTRHLTVWVGDKLRFQFERRHFKTTTDQTDVLALLAKAERMWTK